MKLALMIISLCLLLSCNTNEKSSEVSTSKTETPKTEEPKKTGSLTNCYLYASPADTISLKLIHVGQSITGTLVYNLKEKDRNKGTIQGSMRGNLLVADYTFQSEGMQSVRQVVFKLEGNSLVEGYGDIDMQNDKASFKNIDALQFNNAMKLIEVDCK